MTGTQTHAARQRFAWLDALVRHPDQPRNVFRLGYVIATTFLNNTSGDAWPGQRRLARELGVDVSTVIRGIAWLVANGYLERSAGRGRGHTNHYRLTLPALAHRTRDDAPKPERKPKPSRHKQIDTSSFETFWAVYPRKKDKGAALKVYESVLRAGKATAEQLIEGAQRYAQERAGQEPRYTKHPKTWLNAESWQNEPEEPGLASSEAGAMSAVRGIMGWRH